jgi:hypothetical protein
MTIRNNFNRDPETGRATEPRPPLGNRTQVITAWALVVWCIAFVAFVWWMA